jgi:hypothetical protein
MEYHHNTMGFVYYEVLLLASEVLSTMALPNHVICVSYRLLDTCRSPVTSRRCHSARLLDTISGQGVLPVLDYYHSNSAQIPAEDSE